MTAISLRATGAPVNARALTPALYNTATLPTVAFMHEPDAAKQRVASTTTVAKDKRKHTRLQRPGTAKRDERAALLPPRPFPPALSTTIDRALAGADALGRTDEPLLPPAMGGVAALAMSGVRRDGLIGQAAVRAAIEESDRLVIVSDVRLAVTDEVAELVRDALRAGGSSDMPGTLAHVNLPVGGTDPGGVSVSDAYADDPDVDDAPHDGATDCPIWGTSGGSVARTIETDLVVIDLRTGTGHVIEVKRGARLGCQHRRRLLEDVLASGLLVRDALRRRGYAVRHGRSCALTLTPGGTGGGLRLPHGMAIDLDEFDYAFGTRAAALVAEARRRHRAGLVRLLAPRPARGGGRGRARDGVRRRARRPLRWHARVLRRGCAQGVARDRRRHAPVAFSTVGLDHAPGALGVG